MDKRIKEEKREGQNKMINGENRKRCQKKRTRGNKKGLKKKSKKSKHKKRSREIDQKKNKW